MASAPLPTPRELRPGVYAPLISIFDANEEPDLVAFTKQVLRVASASVGLVINGSTAEAASLSNAERALFVKTARDALERAGLHTIPIIAGVGVGSTRESIELARQAHLAGADAVIAIPPSAYAAALNRDQDALCQYFADIAASSPLPVMAYSFPAMTGIDLSSDLLLKLARTAPNVCGAKFTCTNIGKMSRVASVTAAATFGQTYPRKSPLAPFLVLAGYSDVLLPTLIVRGSGCITGLANVVPRVVKLLFDESVRAIQTGDAETMRKAQKLQDLVAAADGAVSAHGLTGTKWAVARWFGYGGQPRRPLPPLSADAAAKLEVALSEVVALEMSLQ